ncbi:MAG: hypothetical protein EOM22_00365, partial [Gammaproteobacteria bacterium]|nr:hypothetical protein [Gammaproteobacteria bacterium]
MPQFHLGVRHLAGRFRFSPDGRYAATCAQDSTPGGSRHAIQLWDLESKRLYAVFPGACVFNFSPSRNILIYQSLDESILFRNIEDGRVVQTITHARLSGTRGNDPADHVTRLRYLMLTEDGSELLVGYTGVDEPSHLTGIEQLELLVFHVQEGRLIEQRTVSIGRYSHHGKAFQLCVGELLADPDDTEHLTGRDWRRVGCAFNVPPNAKIDVAIGGSRLLIESDRPDGSLRIRIPLAMIRSELQADSYMKEYLSVSSVAISPDRRYAAVGIGHGGDSLPEFPPNTTLSQTLILSLAEKTLVTSHEWEAQIAH